MDPHNPPTDPYIHNLQQLTQKITYGYYPIDSMSTVKTLCQNLIESIDKFQQKISHPNYSDLTKLQPALDALHSHIDEPTYGAIALLSTSHYSMIKNKLGESKLYICILQHYIHTPIYKQTFAKFQTTIHDKVIDYEVSLDIIAKKKLRILLGPELYYKVYNEVFFKSDLKSCVELHDTGKCVVLRFPRKACVFCLNACTHPGHCYYKWYETDVKPQLHSLHSCITLFSCKYVHTRHCNVSYGCNCSIDRYLCNCGTTKEVIFNLEHLYPALNKFAEN